MIGPGHELERRVVGAVLRAPGLLAETDLEPAAFGHAPHRPAWDALRRVQAAGDPVELQLVGHAMGGRLDACGGSMFLANLLADAVTTVAFDRHAALVAEHALRRRLRAALVSALAHCDVPEMPTADCIDRAERLIRDALERRATRGPVPIGELLRETLAGIRATRDGHSVAVPMGLPDLDTMTAGGMRPGELWILAARPSVGKSALAVQVAEHVATHGGRVLLHSLEMPGVQLGQRILSGPGTPLQRLRSGHVTPGELDTLEARVAGHATTRWWVDTTPGIAVQGIRSAARRLSSREPLALVVVDYLQLVRGEKGIPREQQVAGVSRELKALTLELGLPVLLLAQLNRDGAKAGRRPELHDLRESGAVEQDADGVLFLHRPGEAGTTDVEAIVAKQRMGPCGIRALVFDPSRVRFGCRAGPQSGGESERREGGRW